MNPLTTARTLGLASLGIGLTEIVAPDKIENLFGIQNGQNTGILRILGVREILQGVDILSHRDPTSGIRARVAGDVLDVTLAGIAASKSTRPAGAATALLLLAAIGAADARCAKQLTQSS